MKKIILSGLLVSLLIGSGNVFARKDISPDVNQPSQPKQGLTFDWTGVSEQTLKAKENFDKVIKQLKETTKYYVDTKKASFSADIADQAKKHAAIEEDKKYHDCLDTEQQEETYHDCLDIEQPAKTPFWTTRKKITLVVAAITAIAAYSYCQNNPETIEQIKNTAWIYVQSTYGTAVTYKEYLVGWAFAKAITLKGYLDFAVNTVKNSVAGIAAKKSLRLEERFSWLCNQSKSLAKNLYNKFWPWANAAETTCPIRTNACSLFEGVN